jgi:hypothetical protein
MRGDARVTILKAYCISLPHDTVLLTRIVLHEFCFDFVFRFICDGWQNQATYYYYYYYYYWWGGTESLGICSSPSLSISPWYYGHFVLLYKPR